MTERELIEKLEAIIAQRREAIRRLDEALYLAHLTVQNAVAESLEAITPKRREELEAAALAALDDELDPDTMFDDDPEEE